MSECLKPFGFPLTPNHSQTDPNHAVAVSLDLLSLQLFSYQFNVFFLLKKRRNEQTVALLVFFLKTFLLGIICILNVLPLLNFYVKGPISRALIACISLLLDLQLFVELNELIVDKDHDMRWKERARWIKFEEDVEEETDRWGKPHVASLSFRSLLELRRTITHGKGLLQSCGLTISISG